METNPERNRPDHPADSERGSSHELQRGVAPKILLDQVRNTAPFLFDPLFPHGKPQYRYIDTLRETAERLAASDDLELSHVDYYRLCLSAHHGTVATFVPTDVDNQIRLKLWSPALGVETLSKLGEVVLESKGWDASPVTARLVRHPDSGEPLSGHDGEWFSTAAGAYGCLRRRNPELAAEVAGAIVREVQREADIYVAYKKRNDGLNLLRTATVIAHNLGDLDRVIEAWSVPDDDELKKAVHKAGHEEGKHLFKGVLAEAGRVNTQLMAAENHRHFALRGPRCLRQSADLMITIGPFMDDWGARVAKHPLLSEKDIGSVVEALVDGWERLQKPPARPVGYARAIAGIIDQFPGGRNALSDYVPARIARALKSGPIHQLCTLSKERFEKQWDHMGLSAVGQKPQKSFTPIK